MSLRALVREAWQVAREVGRPTALVVRASWREAMRIFWRSLLPAVWERLVGLLIVVVLLAAFVTLASLASWLRSLPSP